LGRYLKPNEKRIYRGIDRVFGERTIVKGMNGSEVASHIVGKFNSFPNGCAIGLDASRFDRSVSRPVLELVHRHYRRIFGEEANMERLLSMQLTNHGRIILPDGTVRYTVEGGVMSGDIDTSLKGCFIMCALVLAWSRHIGCRVKFVNNGDDCVAFMDRSDEQKFRHGMAEWFAELGFDIVAEPTAYCIEHIEFCQARPVLASTAKYVMCRNPVTATTKDSMSLVDLQSHKTYRRWLGAVGACGLALAGDMPIFSVYYSKYRAMAGSLDIEGVQRHNGFANGLKFLSHGMEHRTGVTDATRLSFWEAWGIPPHIQDHVEEYYAQLDLTQPVCDPDESAPQTRFQAPIPLQSLCNAR